MNKKVLVCNLHSSIDSSTLEDMFTIIGNVTSANVVRDQETGASQGFGYVEMSTRKEAEDCIFLFNGQDKMGQTLMVREYMPAVPKQEVPVKIVRMPVFKKAGAADLGKRAERKR